MPHHVVVSFRTAVVDTYDRRRPHRTAAHCDAVVVDDSLTTTTTVAVRSVSYPWV